MNKKKILLKTSIFFCLVSFLIPFFLKSNNDSWVTVLGTAFTSLGAIATFITLLIAIFLFNKFSLENKFLENQTLKVLELADYLKGKTIKIKTENFTYYLRFNIDDPKLEKELFYEKMKSKTVVINFDDFSLFTDTILEMKRSYWLPQEIKEKLEFLNIYGIKEIPDNLEEANLAKVFFKDKSNNEDFYVTLPNLTVEELLLKKNILVKEIHNWLNKYSEIKIDLKLEEPEKYIDEK